MFQPYRVKLQKTVFQGVRAYTYRNCSIGVSREEGKLTVSIAPHDYEKKPVLPGQQELDDLLAYFGIDPASPYETFQIKHHGRPGFGNTQYFVQPEARPAYNRNT